MIDHILKSFGPFCLALFLFCAKALAFDLWSLPLEPELKTLKVTNLTSQVQSFWMQAPRDPASLQAPEDRSFQLAPYATEDIPLNDFGSIPWLRLLSEQSKVFQLQLETSSETRTLLNPGSTTRWKVRALSQSELVIFNQAPFEQKIQISAPGEIAQTVTLQALAKTRWPLPATWKGALLTVAGSARIGGFLLDPSGPRAWIPDPNPVELQTSSEASYFRLSNKNDSQSYLVQLTDPTLIAQARKQIENPKAFLPRILVARVAAGHGDFNRDFSTAPHAPWSWHITEVFRFADLSSQQCDGSPELLEETLGPWLQNSGVICFWNYRVVEELKASQVSKGH